MPATVTLMSCTPEDLAPVVGVSDRTMRRWCQQRLVRPNRAALGGHLIGAVEAAWVDRWGMRLAAALRVLRVHPQVSLVVMVGRASDPHVVLGNGEPVELLVSCVDPHVLPRLRDKLVRAFGCPVRFSDYERALVVPAIGIPALETGRPLSSLL